MKNPRTHGPIIRMSGKSIVPTTTIPPPRAQETLLQSVLS